MTQVLIGRTRLRHDYGLQLKLLKTMLCITLLSPLLAYVGAMLSARFAPDTPLTLGDLAVAAFLRGDVALSATQFEQVLGLRDRFMDGLTGTQAPLWVTVLLSVLAIVALALSGRALLSLWHLRRSIRGSYLWRRTAGCEIRVSDTADIPFASRGVIRRYVVLPSRLMTDPAGLRIVLAHELQHLRRGDVEWEFAFGFLRPLLFWNPAFALWKHNFDHLRELGCDQAVMASGRISPRAYANCLLDFCARGANGPTTRIMTVALVRPGARRSRRMLERRILAICNLPSRTRSGGLLPFAAVFFLSVGGVLAAASVRPPADWSHDRLMLSAIANLERLEAINRGGTGARLPPMLDPDAD
ncbi:M56 family metallopeptidase [Sulfitobacter sp. LCG007]